MFCFGIFFSSPAFAQEEPEPEDLTDYKIACLAAIDNINKIGNGISLSIWESLAFNTAISGAKAGLDECKTSDEMIGVMTSLRALATALLQAKVTFSDNLVFTGLVGNQSFDTGDLSLWNTIGFDLTKVDIDKIRNDIINNGDVSGLVDAVIVNEWKENTKAIENEGENAMSGGHSKYYLNSDCQLLMQPLIGLPAGVYSFNAKVACPNSFIITNNVYLNALVISADVVREFVNLDLPLEPGELDFNSIFSSISIWDIIQGKVDLKQLASEKLPEILGMESVSGWTDVLSNTSKIWENIEPLLQFGRLYSGVTKVYNNFQNAEMKFMVDEGDVVIIGINAGATQFIGAEQYRADNLRITGLHSLGGILSSARADLTAALAGLKVVEANYNADAAEGAAQPAFTYDKVLTENYNNALQTAQNRRIKRLRDILTQDDLNDLDLVDEKLKQYVAEINADIKALNAAREAFEKGAFIAPKASDQFNILMNSTTSEWAGNAVSVDDDMTLHFSQTPGRSAVALAFSFEKASEEASNQLYAFVNDGQNKYYLGEKEGNLTLTISRAEAVVVTAVPSYTTEGEVSLMVGDKYLGTTGESNLLVKTDAIQMTELSVPAAAEMTAKVRITKTLGVSTVILPFDAELPAGVSACAVTGVATDLPYVVSSPVTSLKANTPACIMGPAGEYAFKGVPRAVKTAYESGVLVGRHTDYTTQGGNEYELTFDWDGYAGFSRKDGCTIVATECYLKANNPNDFIFFREGDAVTGIESIQNSKFKIQNEGGAIYNLQGQMVNGQMAGGQRGIYIQDGKKILR